METRCWAMPGTMIGAGGDRRMCFGRELSGGWLMVTRARCRFEPCATRATGQPAQRRYATITDLQRLRGHEPHLQGLGGPDAA